MAHKHSVYDTDSHFIINPITRAIKNDSSSKVLLMQYDHNSERFTFEVDKLVDGHDMSKCSTIQVHYINIDSVTKATTKGLYEVNDMQLSPDSDNKVIFSWLISQNATNYAGQLNFLIKFICINDDKTTIDYQWHSSIYTGISISNGMNNSESVVEEYADVLEKWKKELIDAGTLTDEDIEKAVNSYMDKNPVSLDYNNLKNKPFYNEELSRKTVVSQTTLTGFSKWQDGLYGKGSKIDYTLQEGAFYDVTFDGKVYENLKCFLDEEDLTIGAPYGNFSIYPFGIYQDNATLGFFTNSTSSSHSFKIDKVEKNLKYIDDGVIPETIARVNQIPTKTSELENDSNFLTQHQSLDGYAKKTDIPKVPTKTSQLENDSNFLTEHQDISSKQDKLIDGENIKTINGESLLGSGDIEIQGGSSNVVDLTKEQSLTDEQQATVRKNISAVKVWLSEDGTTLFIDSGG